MIGFKFGTSGGVKIGIIERTYLGSLISSSEISRDGYIYGSLDGILLWWEDGTELGSLYGYADRFKIGLYEGTELWFSVVPYKGCIYGRIDGYNNIVKFWKHFAFDGAKYVKHKG